MKYIPVELDLRITDHWGVHWSPLEIVRDFLQNFYDANSPESIIINITDSTVKVSAPEKFDGQLLDYLSTDKKYDDNVIGQYGEGYKAAVLNIMRNHNCEVTMIIGSIGRIYFFKEVKLGQTMKKVLHVRIVEYDDVGGSKLIIKNCPVDIIQQFRFGLDFFEHQNNRLFGEILAKSGNISIYKSPHKNGYLFYKKLLRGTFTAPLTIVCNRQYKSIDSKIQHDRDRKAFDDKVKNSLLKLVFKRLGFNQKKRILEFLEPLWEQGHLVLSALADSMSYRDHDFIFPNNYYAADTKHSSRRDISYEERKVVLDDFKSKNYIGCPGYMAKLGMKTPTSIAFELRKKHNQSNTREPSAHEQRALNVLLAFAEYVAPNLHERFRNAKYLMGESETVLGELRSPYGRKAVYLNVDIFSHSFADAISLILHEWSHIYGFDGSRGFTDALTHLISTIINNKSILARISKYELLWNDRSRTAQSKDDIKNTHKRILLEKLTEQQKEDILNQLSLDELKSIMNKN